MVDIEKRGGNIPLPSKIPPWLLHFLVHVVKRCCMTTVKYIKLLEKDKQSGIEPWALDFLINVIKNCCMIVVKYIDDLQQEEKRKVAN